MIANQVRPTAAFTLSTIGLVFQVLGGLMLFYLFSYQVSYDFRYGMMGHWMMFAGSIWA